MDLKVKTSDLKKYRELKLKEQNGLCGLCGLPLTLKDSVVDHDHSTGKIRKILHIGCNGFEGRVKGAFKRYIGESKGILLPEFILNLHKYLNTDYTNNPIHPTELTPEEKELKLINKKLKKLKQERAILKNKERAKQLRKIIKEDREKNKWNPPK